MKIVELLTNIHITISNEEADLLTQFENNQALDKKQLDQRQQVVANQLVNKDILLRRYQHGQTTYTKKIKD